MEILSKRRLFGAFCMFGLQVCLMAVFNACTDDFGIEADFFKGKIEGRLFINQAVPENTDEIRVAVSEKFPPTDFRKLIISSVVPVDTSVTSDTVEYDLDLPLGTYDYIFAVWKEKDRSFSLSSILGQFGDILGSPITLTEENPVLTGIDINITFERVLRGGFIGGKITFVGDIPPTTAGIAYIASEIVPTSPIDFFTHPPTLEIISGGELNISEFNYQYAIKPGTYKYIAVVWLEQGANLLDFKTLGIYEDPNAPGEPGEVVIEKGPPGATGVDIIADFANINK